MPNNDDILHSRRRTSDIQKLKFKVDYPSSKSGQPQIEQTFCMFDVGGQRGERRKWIQVFDGVSAVMFLIDSSSFDCTDEESGKNKLRESLELFHEVWTTRFLLNSNFVLLFNKQDILREKLERGIAIEEYFPEFASYKTRQQDKASLMKAGEKLNLFRSSKRTSRLSSLAHDWNVGSIGGSVDDNQSIRSKSTINGRKLKSQSMYDTYLNPNSLATKSSNQNRYSLRESIYVDKICEQSPCNLNTAKSGTSKSDSSLETTSNACYESKDSSSNSSSPSSSLRNISNAYYSGSNDDQDELAEGKQTSNKYLRDSRQGSFKSASPQETYVRARSFIKDMFLQITRQPDLNLRKYIVPNINVYDSSKCNIDQPKRVVCYHYTTATDTENVRELFTDLKKMMMKSCKSRR